MSDLRPHGFAAFYRMPVDTNCNQLSTGCGFKVNSVFKGFVLQRVLFVCVYHSQWPVKDPGSDLNTDSLLRVVGVLFQVKYA